VSVVERLYAALNAHDVDAFAACYAPDATIEDGHDAVLARGHAALRERFGGILEEHPAARWVPLERIEVGPFVVLHEEVVGRGEPGRQVCVYLVDGDVILRETVLA
jgi:hypothetical protein